MPSNAVFTEADTVFGVRPHVGSDPYRWAKKVIFDTLLCVAAREIESGHYEAGLGGGLCKKRVERRATPVKIFRQRLRKPQG